MLQKGNISNDSFSIIKQQEAYTVRHFTLLKY